jgi:hypothetical protein
MSVDSAQSMPSASVTPSADLAAALSLNAQMQAAGAELQKKVAALELEKANLLAQQQALRSAAASSSSNSFGPSQKTGYPKGPTPPEFNGAKTGGFEIDSWVRDMKTQFMFYGASVFPDDAAKVRHAAMFLKGRAAEWWEAEDKSTGVHLDWSRFVDRLHERYRPMQAAVVARERLRRLKQTGHVSAYADLFQKELTPITDMAPSDQVFNFVSGLSNPAVANKVREKEPQTLHAAMDIAVRAEAFLAPNRSNAGGYHGPSRQGGGGPANGSVPMDLNVFHDMEDQDEDHADQTLAPGTTRSTAPEVGFASLLTKMEEMVEHRVNAMMQSSFKKNPSNDRVPGLKTSDIDRLRAEGRCFRCKQKGHNKSECPQRSGMGKPSFQ